MTYSCSVVLITTPNRKLADKLGQGLVEKRLAACVNQVFCLRSIYWWEGKIESAKETLLIAKTRTALVSRLIAHVKKHHPYSVPEIISLPVQQGNAAYLNWIKTSTK